MGTITLIRHGQASFGKANYDQLSELGYEQGRVLGQWLSQCAKPITRVVTGGMARHRQTAEACLETLDETLKPAGDWHEEPGFAEYDHIEMLHRYEPRFGDPDYVRALFQEHPNPRKAFQEVFVAAFARWMSGEHDADYRESWPAFRARTTAAVERLSSEAGKSEHIAVFTSGGPITAICQQLLQVPDSQIAELNSRFANASITRLLFQPGRLSLATMNSFAHFEVAPHTHLITYR